MARSTDRRTSGLTFGEPLTTRETVARETPASRATPSRVAPRPFPPCVEVPTWEAAGRPSGEVLVRALSRVMTAQYTPCQESGYTNFTAGRTGAAGGR